MLKDNKIYIFNLLKKYSSNPTLLKYSSNPTLFAQLADIIKKYLLYIKEQINIWYQMHRKILRNKRNPPTFNHYISTLTNTNEQKNEIKRQIEIINSKIDEYFPLIFYDYCDEKNLYTKEFYRFLINKQNEIDNSQIMNSQIMSIFKKIYKLELNVDNLNFKLNFKQIIQNIDELIKYIDNLYNLMLIKEEPIAQDVLNHIGRSYLGGTKFVHVKGIGKRKVRYYKNGNRYIIVHGKKKKL